MNRIPKLIISSDWHLKKENIDQITDLFVQKCDLGDELGVNNFAILGDIFDSRVSQREDVLNAFSNILEIASQRGKMLYVIPGNHDKTDYSGNNSFLTPFKNHKNLFLTEIQSYIPIDGLNLYFIPFFVEDRWLHIFEDLKEYHGEFDKKKKHILLTHVAVTGSRNNDGSMVSSKLTTRLFETFDKVLSGHYHDMQKIGDNFYHVPSIRQNNYGENVDKGFTILYHDGYHELVKSNFKRFIKININVDDPELNLSSLKSLYGKSDDNIRIEFCGSENVLKSIKKEDFTYAGIDVKMKVKEIEDDIEFIEGAEVKEHTKTSLVEEFKAFCEKENLNYEKGLEFLNKKLNQ